MTDLEVAPSGGKLWRWKYRYEGKEKRLALGAYPEVELAEARERHAEARKLLAIRAKRLFVGSREPRQSKRR
ncbi:Arm DNA-binding domain-containing protein [Luteimonas sp. A478]